MPRQDDAPSRHIPVTIASHQGPQPTRQMIFRRFPFAYTPSYPDREQGGPAPVYPAQTLEQMQRRLAALADLAVRDEIEREHSNGNEGQAPLSDAA